ncbi:MAG: hypothetical protein CMC81_03910 [Flavobacteriaceae bacterium]|nr:hypothetical protein [Flavobacteriaceae bacterium]
MVTGQRFLMPRENKKNHHDSSLILIGKEGFNYLDNFNSEYISIDMLPLSINEKVNNWIDSTLITNNKIEIIIANNSSLFVPKRLYDDNFKEHYYEKNDKIEDGDKLISDTTKNHLIEVIYKISNEIELFLNKLKNETKIKHINTFVYNFLALYNRGNFKNKLYVNIGLEFFNVFLFFGQELQLANSYSNEGRESFLYYIFYIIEKMKLLKNDFTISFLGKYDFYHKFYEDTLKFTENVEFISLKDYKNKYEINPFIIEIYENNIRKS